MMRRLKVVLVAHHMNPNWGSEPLIAWRWAANLKDRVDLTVITHIRNRSAIEAQGELGFTVHYVDTERLASWVNRVNDRVWPSTAVVARSLLESLALKAFDRKAVRIAKRLVKEEAIDVIHRVSPISPKAPSGLGELGVPFVIGPLNGGMQMAKGFADEAKREFESAMKLRSLARLLDPRSRTLRKAGAIFVASETTRTSLPPHARSRAIILCENAVATELYTPRYERHGGLDEPLRLLYLGRLLPYKGVQFILDALSKTPPGLATLDVIGDGPERPALEALREKLGLADCVRFHGAVGVDEVPDRMASADLFVLPSLRESGGAVLLEAMAAGTPVVCLDHGGPSETVNAEVGVLLRARSAEALGQELGGVIRDLAADEPRRLQLAKSARRHVSTSYSWKGKAEAAIEVYRDLCRVSHRAPLVRLVS